MVKGAAFGKCVRTMDAIRRHVVTPSKTPLHTSAHCLSAPNSGSPLRAEVDPGTGNGTGHLVVLRSEYALQTGYGKYGLIREEESFSVAFLPRSLVPGPFRNLSAVASPPRAMAWDLAAGSSGASAHPALWSGSWTIQTLNGTLESHIS